jgi:hypothetical protein
LTQESKLDIIPIVTRFYEHGISIDLTEDQWARVDAIKKRPPEERGPKRLKMSLLGTKGLIFDIARYCGGGETIKEG